MVKNENQRWIFQNNCQITFTLLKTKWSWKTINKYLAITLVIQILQKCSSHLYLHLRSFTPPQLIWTTPLLYNNSTVKPIWLWIATYSIFMISNANKPAQKAFSSPNFLLNSPGSRIDSISLIPHHSDMNCGKRNSETSPNIANGRKWSKQANTNKQIYKSIKAPILVVWILFPSCTDRWPSEISRRGGKQPIGIHQL